MKGYKKSTLIAMACGALTLLLGVTAAVFPRESVCSLVVTVTVLVNALLHFESYVSTLRLENRAMPNVLAMAITETVLLVFFLVCIQSQGWPEFEILFCAYLVFNATSLMVIPSTMARNFGISALVMAVLLFMLGRTFTRNAGVLTGLNLVLNGGERILMSVKEGKRKT